MPCDSCNGNAWGPWSFNDDAALVPGVRKYSSTWRLFFGSASLTLFTSALVTDVAVDAVAFAATAASITNETKEDKKSENWAKSMKWKIKDLMKFENYFKIWISDISRWIANFHANALKAQGLKAESQACQHLTLKGFLIHFKAIVIWRRAEFTGKNERLLMNRSLWSLQTEQISHRISWNCPSGRFDWYGDFLRHFWQLSRYSVSSQTVNRPFECLVLAKFKGK